MKILTKTIEQITSIIQEGSNVLANFCEDDDPAPGSCFDCCCGGNNPGSCCCCEPRRLLRWTVRGDPERYPDQNAEWQAIPSEIMIGGGTTDGCCPKNCDGSLSDAMVEGCPDKYCCCNRFEQYVINSSSYGEPYERECPPQYGYYPAHMKEGYTHKRDSSGYGDSECFVKKSDLSRFHLGYKSYWAIYELWVMCDSLTAYCDIHCKDGCPDQKSECKSCTREIAGFVGTNRCSKKFRDALCTECEMFCDNNPPCASYACDLNLRDAQAGCEVDCPDLQASQEPPLDPSCGHGLSGPKRDGKPCIEGDWSDNIDECYDQNPAHCPSSTSAIPPCRPSN